MFGFMWFFKNVMVEIGELGRILVVPTFSDYIQYDEEFMHCVINHVWFFKIDMVEIGERNQILVVPTVSDCVLQDLQVPSETNSDLQSCLWNINPSVARSTNKLFNFFLKE